MESHETPELKAVAKEEREQSVAPAFKDAQSGQTCAMPPDPPPAANIVKIERAGALAPVAAAQEASHEWRRFDFAKALPATDPLLMLDAMLQMTAETGVDGDSVKLPILPNLYFAKNGRALRDRLLAETTRESTADTMLAQMAVNSLMLQQMALGMLSTISDTEKLSNALADKRSVAWGAFNFMKESDQNARAALGALRRLKGSAAPAGSIHVAKALNVQIQQNVQAQQGDAAAQEPAGSDTVPKSGGKPLQGLEGGDGWL